MNSIILVFGCTGQDGSYLCKSLLEKNQTVIGVSRAYDPNRKNHSALGIEKNFPIIKADLSDSDSVEKIITQYKPNQIYNLSAQSSVGLSFIKPRETQESIVNSTFNLLEIARKLGYQDRIFFAGSSEIYGNTLKPAKIDSKIDIRSPYAAAKYQSMLLVKLYRETYNLRCMTGVLFNHESPLRGPNFVTQKIISGAIKSAKDPSNKLHLGNINIIRDWGCAKEYVEAMQKIINSKKIKDHIVCTGRPKKLKEFIDLVFKKFDLDWEEHVLSDKKFFRKNDIKISVGNATEIEKELNWSASKELNQLVEELVNAKNQD